MHMDRQFSSYKLGLGNSPVLKYVYPFMGLGFALSHPTDFVLSCSVGFAQSCLITFDQSFSFFQGLCKFISTTNEAPQSIQKF